MPNADRAGRIPVGPDLSVPGLQNVFAAGDLASVKDKDGKPVPGIAPAAKQMGRYIGRLIAARVAGRKTTSRSPTAMPAIWRPSDAGPPW